MSLVVAMSMGKPPPRSLGTLRVFDRRTIRGPLQHFPRTRNVGLSRRDVPDREPDDIAPAEACAREEDLTGRVHPIDQSLVLLVARFETEADGREGIGRLDRPAGLVLDPGREEPCEP